MTDFLVGEVAAPTSDAQVDSVRALQRLAQEVINLQRAVNRGVPPGYKMVIEDDQVWLFNNADRTKARIPVEWIPQ